MFDALGKFVARHWAAVLAAWMAVLVAMLLIAPPTGKVRSQNDSAFLPESVPSRWAVEAIESKFDRPPALSVAAVVIERVGGLTGLPQAAMQGVEPDSDWLYLVRLTARLQERSRQSHWALLSPADPCQYLLRSVLVSPSERAAVIKIDLPCGFVSRDAFEAVDWIERAVTEAGPPTGLNVAVTGSASYGRDSNNASEISLKRTTWVCVIAVILILVITYRALPAAGISLVAVTAAVVVSISILGIGSNHGWSVTVLVEIFTIVVGYGAGTDFSLFFLSRYREELGRCRGDQTQADRREALSWAMEGTGPAIVASAGTVAAGLSLMYFATFRVLHTTGPAIAIGIALACISSLTLAPALVCLLGSRTFWPRRIPATPNGADSSRGPWNRLAAFAVRRHVPILIIGLIALAPLAVSGWRQQVVYDTLTQLPQSDPSIRGARMFTRHFPIGEMSPVRIMVQLPRPLSEAEWTAVALAVDGRLAAMPQVQTVRSLSHPLGLKGPEISPQEVSFLTAPAAGTTVPATEPSGLLSGAGKLLDIPAGAMKNLSGLQDARSRFQGEVLPRYMGRDKTAGLWEVALPWPPYSNQALNSLDALDAAVRDAVRQALPIGSASPRVLIAGDTALMRDLRHITDHDFWLVAPMVVVSIVVIVTILIRDLPTALLVMLATILTYGAALALTAWVFHLAFGTVGLDWKVNFSLFVILVAVGQDYNLFMLTRIMEQRRVEPLRPAVQSAIARTGSVISYCGLIMAATLGSLATSPLRLLQQLGVAFVIGLLIDTFLVRPLMVPAFILMFRRMDRPRPAEGDVTSRSK
ncbi:MAG: MMPL family transporter [Phycisphaerae bacterium]